MNKFKQWLESYNNRTELLYKNFSIALDKWFNGKQTGNIPINMSFTSELVDKLGFNFSDLRGSGVIVKSDIGNWQLNKDLVATNGKLGTPPPIPSNPLRRKPWE